MQNRNIAVGAATDSKHSPYVGPRPFTTADRDIFFGRNQEAIELTSLIKAHPEVLLYAPSGAGKTSLLYAEVLPVLEQEEDFDTLPAARVRSQESAMIPDEKVNNIYVFNALKDLSNDSLTVIERAQLKLSEFLKKRPRAISGEWNQRDEEYPPERRLPRVVVFDQFEEIFTLYPERYRDRQDFFAQVAEALEADPFLRVVFSMREDYIAELDPYAGLLPQGLRTRFRLERLRRNNALAGVKRPLETERCKETGRHFSEGAAESLVDKLLTIKVKTPSGEKIEVPGEFVDPVQLQVVCQTLWEKLPPQELSISKKDIAKYANVDEALLDFYQTSIRKAVIAANNRIEATLAGGGTSPVPQPVTEGLVRGWFEQKLITREGKRNMVNRERDTTAGLPNIIVDELENQHLIRVEMRGGEPWYELSHDRFIPPIRESNRRFLLQQPIAKRKAQELEQRAEEWWNTQRDPKLLLDRGELSDAQNWMRTEAAAIGYSNTLYTLVQASEAAIQHEENIQQQALADALQQKATAERQRSRQLRIGWVVTSVLLLFTIGSTVFAFNRWTKAQSANAAATKAAEDLRKANEKLTVANTEAELARTNAEQAAGQLKATNEKLTTAIDDLKKANDRAEDARIKAEEARNIAVQQKTAANLISEQLKAFNETLNQSRQTAWSAKLAGDANLYLKSDPELSERFALEALTRSNTREARYALRQAVPKWAQVPAVLPHADVVWNAIYGPDGRIITISEDGAVRIWKNAKEEPQQLKAPAAVHALSISADGNWLATEVFNDTGRIWNLRDGSWKDLHGLTGPLAALAISPNGKLLVTEATDPNGVEGASPRVWDVATGTVRTTLRGHTKAVCSISYHPKKDLVATASWDNTARIWNTDNGASLHVLSGHTGPLTTVAFNPSGTLLVTGSYDGTARVWDVETGAEKFRLEGHTGTVSSAIFSPDGQYILTGGEDVTEDLKTTDQVIALPPEIKKRVGTKDNSARLWNAINGQLIAELKGHRGSISSVAFSSDSKLLLTASTDRTAIVWDLSGEPVTRLTGHRSAVLSAEFGPADEKILTASADRTSQVWPWKSYKRGAFAAHRGTVTSAGFSSDGSIVTAGRDGGVRFWNLLGKRKPGGAEVNVTQKAISTGELRDLSPESAFVYAIAMSPKGDSVATASRQGARQDTQAHIWDVRSQKFTHDLAGHKSPVTKVVFSASGRYLLTMSEDIAQAWDTSKWTVVSEIKRRNDGSVILDTQFQSNEESFSIAENDGTLQVRQLALQAQPPKSRALRIGGVILTMAFDPAGARVATVTQRDKRLWTEIWTLDGSRLSTLRKPTGNVYNLVFSPASDLLATTSLDGFVRVWETETGEAVTEFQFAEFVSALGFRLDNTALVAGTEGGSVYIFDCEACHSFTDIAKEAAENPPRELTDEEKEFYLPEEKDFASPPEPQKPRIRLHNKKGAKHKVASTDKVRRVGIS